MVNAPIDSLVSRRDALEALLSRIDMWLLIFGVVVVIGVAGESIFGIRAWWNNRKLHFVQRSIDEFRQAETASFNKQAADANKEAGLAQQAAADAKERAANAEQHLGQANERAAKALEQAAKSNETAEREKLARLQLEARLAPRSLSLAQQNDLIDRLRPFAGTQLDIFIYGDTSEMLSIGFALASTATAAGWTVRTWGVSVEMVVTGVVVGTKSGVDRKIDTAALALVAALNQNGVTASHAGNVFELPLPGRLTGPDWNINAAASMRMLVGNKP